MKKIIIYLIIGLLVLVLILLKSQVSYAQQDSIIYQEEPIEESDYKPRVFSWSWSNPGGNHVIVTPNLPPVLVPPHIPDIQLHFDGKEFERRMHKLEEKMDRIQWHFQRDLQKGMHQIKIEIDTVLIDKNNPDTNVKKIIIEKPHKRKEIIISPHRYHYSVPPNLPYTHEERIEIRESKKKTKDKKEEKYKRHIHELENKIQQLEKRLNELEKNNVKQK